MWCHIQLNAAEKIASWRHCVGQFERASNPFWFSGRVPEVERPFGVMFSSASSSSRHGPLRTRTASTSLLDDTPFPPIPDAWKLRSLCAGSARSSPLTSHWMTPFLLSPNCRLLAEEMIAIRWRCFCVQDARADKQDDPTQRFSFAFQPSANGNFPWC